MRTAILLLLIVQMEQSHGDLRNVDFIKSFIENERKPTHLVYRLCWTKAIKNRLVKEMSRIGVRASTNLDISKYLDHGTLFVMDLGCPDAEEVILNATSKTLLRWPYRWLAITSSTEPEASSKFIWESPLLVDSDFVLAQTINQRFKVIELHKPSSQGPMQSFLRGYYNGSFTDLRTFRTLYGRRRDVMGYAITMANVIQDSNSTQDHLPKEDRLEPQHDSIAKISWSNARLAFEMLNATPQYIFSHRWGYKQNKKWSGMIGDLEENRADLGTNCLVRPDRLAVVVFTDVIAPFRVRFIFRQPPLSYVSNIFSLPFSTGVWVAMVICTAISTVALYVASKWEASLGKSSTQIDGIGDALLLTMSAVSQQGCVLEPRKASGRMIVLVVFAALMALYAAYSANIVVLLQAPSNSIRTLAQLAHSKVTLAANDVDYNHFVFKLYRDDPVRVEIYKKIDPEKGKKQFYDKNVGVEKIRQGLFAFHSIVEPVYRRIEETFLETEKCDLMEVDFLNDFDPFTPIKKDSPYLELLRVAFKHIRESGIRSALTKRMQVPKPRCSSKGSAFSSVGLLDLKPVVILMLYGAAISIMIAAVEVLSHKVYAGRAP